MNVLALIKSLKERALRLEDEASAIRAEAGQLQAMFLGEPTDAPETVPDSVVPQGKTAPAVPQMPNRDVIRAKAAEFGVDVEDLLPLGKRPTLQQKQDAMKRIVEAKRAAQVHATAS